MSDKRSPAKQAVHDGRQDKLAAALRTNLRRRKAQARATRADAPDPAPTGEPEPPEPPT